MKKVEGTGIACANITGRVGAMLYLNPNLTATEIREKLQMGYFKRQNIANGDAVVTINVMCGLTPMTVKARVWIQPAEPEDGIPNAYVDDYVLLDAETEEEINIYVADGIERSEGIYNIKNKIDAALKELANDI